MIKVTNTEKEDFDGVIALIDHVFGNCFSKDKMKMEEIFTDLLSENNMEHMRIIKENDKPVSVINYIINEIDIKGCVIKAASIGAVCTHEEYRCKGYSNLILKDCLDKIRSEGIDFLYVSGEIGLYTKNNIHITGKMYNFNITRNFSAEHKELINDTCELKECRPEDFPLLYPFYDAEEVKFIREKQRFLDLAKRVPGVSVCNMSAKVFIIEENRQIQGYFICSLIPQENGDFKMEVVEYAGKRKSVLAGMIKAVVQLKATGISGYTAWFDTDMVKALEEYEIKTEPQNYPGTMRIINFTQLMQKLKPLHAQGKIVESIDFSESDGNYIIRSGNMKLVIENDRTMHNLFLGNAMESLETEYIHGDNKLLELLKIMLPVPVPYPYNLNYI